MAILCATSHDYDVRSRHLNASYFDTHNQLGERPSQEGNHPRSNTSRRTNLTLPQRMGINNRRPYISDTLRSGIKLDLMEQPIANQPFYSTMNQDQAILEEEVQSMRTKRAIEEAPTHSIHKDLFRNVHRPSEEREEASNHQLQVHELLGNLRTLQNGRISECQGIARTRILHDEDRLEGRLLPRTDTRRIQRHATIRLERPTLRIQSNAIRHHICTGIHQDHAINSKNHPFTRHKISNLSRRHADNGGIRIDMPNQHENYPGTTATTRTRRKLEEINSGSISEAIRPIQDRSIRNSTKQASGKILFNQNPQG